MTVRVLFLGGNGHAEVRLASARDVLARLLETPSPRFDLVDVPYPGFEGRPRADTLDAFIRIVAGHVEPATRSSDGPVLVYATGIGGLIALCLRAHGIGLGLPLLLQAPVLWGLERRWMPRLMRMRPVRWFARWLFGSPVFQRHFTRRYFTAPVSADFAAAFFDGYARCTALEDLFAWLTPHLLRTLESRFGTYHERLADITVWLGARDRVVTLSEVEWTRRALGVGWPMRVFPTWGHYPMIDQPEEWVAVVDEAVRDPRRF